MHHRVFEKGSVGHHLPLPLYHHADVPSHRSSQAMIDLSMTVVKDLPTIGGI